MASFGLNGACRKTEKKCKRWIPERKAPHVSNIKGNFFTIMVQMADFLIK